MSNKPSITYLGPPMRSLLTTSSRSATPRRCLVLLHGTSSRYQCVGQPRTLRAPDTDVAQCLPRSGSRYSRGHRVRASCWRSSRQYEQAPQSQRTGRSCHRADGYRSTVWPSRGPDSRRALGEADFARRHDRRSRPADCGYGHDFGPFGNHRRCTGVQASTRPDRGGIASLSWPSA